MTRLWPKKWLVLGLLLVLVNSSYGMDFFCLFAFGDKLRGADSDNPYLVRAMEGTGYVSERYVVGEEAVERLRVGMPVKSRNGVVTLIEASDGGLVLRVEPLSMLDAVEQDRGYQDSTLTPVEAAAMVEASPLIFKLGVLDADFEKKLETHFGDGYRTGASNERFNRGGWNVPVFRDYRLMPPYNTDEGVQKFMELINEEK